MKKLDYNKLFSDNRFLRIFSLGAALLCWLLVAMTQSYTSTTTVRHVPVNLELQQAALSSIGLSVIEGGESYVDIEVEGVRAVIGQLKPEDFTISTKITGVTQAGAYDLSLVSMNTTPGADFTIKSFSPKTIPVRLDSIDTRTFAIKEQINGLGIESGYTEKTTTVTPNSVNITGPASSLDKIKTCIIKTELESPLNKPYTKSCPIILLDENGEEMDLEAQHLLLDTNEAQLMIQVLKITELPLEVRFTVPPAGFPLEEMLEIMHKSQESVTIAGPADAISKLTEIQLGYINLKDITLENVGFSFPVPLPSPSDQFMRLDNITSVVVSFESTKWESAVFNVSNLQLINAPVGFTVTTPAKNIYNVTFVGNADVLQAMTPDDIVAEIDLSQRELLTGSYSLPVKISVPGKGLVWAVGDHSITVQVEEKEQEIDR